jgi:hypothetical protein
MIFAVRFRYPIDDDLGKWACVTPSAKQPGRWQWTWFNDEGPAGDTCRDSAREVIDEVLRDGWVPESVTGPDHAAGSEILNRAIAERAAQRAMFEEWLGRAA